jgi:2-(1,2-epoxy-1,2-dihydrophenyl)acetyl-CoA isomerase
MISSEMDGAVMRLRLERPEALNALTAELVEELIASLREAEAERVRAVVLTGAGRAFCAGSDLTQNFSPGAPPPEANLRSSRHPLLLSMRALPKPIICAVNGVAAGIGVSLALAGDLVVASETASFHLAFTKIGLAADGGATWFLNHAVGRVRAQRLLMLGESLDGPEAERLGLVASCFPDETFADEVDRLALRLAEGPTLAYGLLKGALDAAPGNDLATQLELEATLQARAARSDDFDEGRSAFLEKRAAVFKGN